MNTRDSSKSIFEQDESKLVTLFSFSITGTDERNSRKRFSISSSVHSYKLRCFFELLLAAELSACTDRFHLLFGAINQEACVNRCINDDGVGDRCMFEQNERTIFKKKRKIRISKRNQDHQFDEIKTIFICIISTRIKFPLLCITFHFIEIYT